MTINENHEVKLSYKRVLTLQDKRTACSLGTDGRVDKLNVTVIGLIQFTNPRTTAYIKGHSQVNNVVAYSH